MAVFCGIARRGHSREVSASARIRTGSTLVPPALPACPGRRCGGQHGWGSSMLHFQISDLALERGQRWRQAAAQPKQIPQGSSTQSCSVPRHPPYTSQTLCVTLLEIVIPFIPALEEENVRISYAIPRILTASGR